jgi:hypothetical protein
MTANRLLRRSRWQREFRGFAGETKGWRNPIGAVNVTRPSKWENPYKVRRGHLTAEEAALSFRRDLFTGYLHFTVDDIRRELAGKNFGFEPTRAAAEGRIEVNP